jgi:hypothetical protein
VVQLDGDRWMEELYLFEGKTGLGLLKEEKE